MSIEAMKQALEALETERDIYREHDEDGAPEYILEAITSLRQAIAEAEKQEPVGEVEQIDYDDEGTASAWFTLNDSVEIGDKLYTSPPQRQPLTDEQIQECWYRTQGEAEDFARAIEAAHGIKGE